MSNMAFTIELSFNIHTSAYQLGFLQNACGSIMALSDQFPNFFRSHMRGYFSKHDVFFICKNLQRYLFMWNIIFMIHSPEYIKQQIVEGFMLMFAKLFFQKYIQFSCPV